MLLVDRNVILLTEIANRTCGVQHCSIEARKVKRLFFSLSRYLCVWQLSEFEEKQFSIQKRGKEQVINIFHAIETYKYLLRHPLMKNRI